MGIGMLQNEVLSEKAKSMLEMLEVSAKRGSGMVKQVLEFARGVSGERVLLKVGHLVRDIQKIIRETFPKSIRLRTELSGNLWLTCADATQIHQVLLNLCINARDAMPSGGSITVTTENKTLDENYAQMNIRAKPGPYIILTVSDTGTGMPPEIIEKMFDPFFTTKEIGKGTGLGLSTVHGIVLSHGGFIDVDSEVGKGTSFHIYLPAEPSSHEKESDLGTTEMPVGNGELILVVDDESTIREIYRSTLMAYDYKVLLAVDGTDAVVKYAHNMNDIRLVVMDMMMPFMDGLATIRALSKIDPQVKIIATSGLSGQEKAIANNNLRIVGFLAKPYTASKLLHAVANGLKQTGKDTSGKQQ
ncbi:MAG: ATP-binding protein, partial [bacterium]